eukprot:TRINITY_DN18683_c0_g1_i1.p1 TRINITY_DN18683_c0_g1~~TRINITY_DN18683_c0_g1_i1.p1  ORF type:complete len:485 (-),score=95.74 TRINITY_DN18683_c0_g1_i1:366-1820(-)
MGCCTCCCKAVLGFILVLVFGLAILTIPQVYHPIEQYYAKNPSLLLLIVAGIGMEKLGHCGSDIVQDTMSYKSVSPKKRICGSLAFERMYGWGEPGVDDSFFFGFRRHTSAAIREIAYDPKLTRSKDIVIAVNTTTIPEEIRELALPGIWPIVIQLNTDDPRRVKHRKFWAENLPALAEVPDSEMPAFRIPKGVVSKDFRDYHAIFAAIAENYFRHLFGTEVDWSGAEIEAYRDAQMNFIGGTATKGIQYKNALAGAVFSVFIGNPAEILAEKRKHLEEQIFSTERAKKFIAQAHEEGILDGKAELRHFIFGLAFAGLLGAPQMAEAIINMIASNPKFYVPLFRKDPEAFMLEAARWQVTVGGMIFLHNKEHKFTFNGKEHTEQPGDYGVTWNAGHNLDPAIFGGPNKDPEYAKKFIPGRENADRLMTWNNELRDVRKCGHAAGCSEAPRPCPGIHLSRRVLRQTIEFFIGGFEEELKAKQQEL